MRQPERGTVKFLVVDDRDENLTAMEALLRRENLEILLARSGNEALEILLQHDIALALVDVQMPEMDGFALAELMRGSEKSKHVPIIFVTASPEEAHRVFRGYDAGAVDFLFKPVDTKVLRHKADVFYDLYRQRQELAETLRLNETFVAAITHDLRNPLSAVIVAAQGLNQSTDERTKRISSRLLSSGQRMKAMIDELSDLARARLGGGIPVHREAIDIAALTSKVIAEFEVRDPEHRIRFSGMDACVGQWDPTRVSQIVSNLVGNALKHGTPLSPISVRLHCDEKEVTFQVNNAGVVPKEMHDTIFNPFRSGREATGASDGLGLGLYIVQQVVTAHGGRISFDSNEADGTTFTVTLPRICA